MGRMPAELPRPTDAELSILRVLWRLGRATVREVHAELEEVSPAGYTTVLKLLQIMTEKGLVHRDETERAHVYAATLAAEETQAQLLRHLLDRAFDGSASLLVQRALSAAPATPEELGQIRRLIQAAERRAR